MAADESLKTPEQLPEVMFDDDATVEQHAAVDDFVALATEVDVDALMQGAELHDANPELVLRVVTYLGNFTMGQVVIDKWHKLSAARPELVTAFDEPTETELQKDPKHQRLVDTVKSADAANEVRAKAAVRRSRFLTLARRIRAFKEAQEAA